MAKAATKKRPKARPKETNRQIANKKLEIVYVPLAKLKPDPENARKHDERNLDAIRKSIESAGVYQPIVVQAKTMRIIAGHGRYEVFQADGIDPAPCVLLQVGDAKAREIALRDNRTAELAEWDGEKLQKLIDSLDDEFQLSMDELGFSQEELDDIIGTAEADVGGEGGGADPEPKSEFKVLVICKDEKEQAALLEWLGEQGHECRALTS